MKKLILVALFVPITYFASAQKTYTTTDSEIIFGVSDITLNGYELDTDLRFTLFYHSATYLNHDISDNLGVFYGLALRNVGFITRDETIGSDLFTTVKRRSYSLGIPVGVKIGSISKSTFLFAGAEYEWMFHYKEKRFINDEKVDKYTDWFSKRTNTFIPSMFVGVTFPKGYSVTFKYYLDDFMNRNFRDGSGNRPYAGMNSQLFYFSLSKMFRYDKFESMVKKTDLEL